MDCESVTSLEKNENSEQRRNSEVLLHAAERERRVAGSFKSTKNVVIQW